jgi:hypothetical protein
VCSNPLVEVGYVASSVGYALPLVNWATSTNQSAYYAHDNHTRVKHAPTHTWYKYQLTAAPIKLSTEWGGRIGDNRPLCAHAAADVHERDACELRIAGNGGASNSAFWPLAGNIVCQDKLGTNVWPTERKKKERETNLVLSCLILSCLAGLRDNVSQGDRSLECVRRSENAHGRCRNRGRNYPEVDVTRQDRTRQDRARQDKIGGGYPEVDDEVTLASFPFEGKKKEERSTEVE